MSRSSSKARYAMILLTLVCTVANADSLNVLSDKSAPPLMSQRDDPVRQYERLTGFRGPSCSSWWIDSKPHAVPVRFLFLFQAPPSHTGGTFDQAIDLVLYLFEHLVMGHPRKIKSIYAGCRKSRDADTCQYYRK